MGLSLLLLTLSIPETPYGLQRGNHRLFAHFFRSYLEFRGGKRLGVGTLPRTLVDLGADAAGRVEAAAAMLEDADDGPFVDTMPFGGG